MYTTPRVRPWTLRIIRIRALVFRFSFFFFYIPFSGSCINVRTLYNGPESSTTEYIADKVQRLDPHSCNVIGTLLLLLRYRTRILNISRISRVPPQQYRVSTMTPPRRRAVASCPVVFVYLTFRVWSLNVIKCHGISFFIYLAFISIFFPNDFIY